MDFIIIESHLNCKEGPCYLKELYGDSNCKLDNGNSPHFKFLFYKHCYKLKLLSSQYIRIIIST